MRHGREPTAREREVLDLLADGATDDQIAALLQLSPATVQTHVRNAKAKLGARTRAQAVALALHRGLIGHSHLTLRPLNPAQPRGSGASSLLGDPELVASWRTLRVERVELERDADLVAREAAVCDRPRARRSGNASRTPPGAGRPPRGSSPARRRCRRSSAWIQPFSSSGKSSRRLRS